MISTEITVRDIENTPAIQDQIEKKLHKLEQFYDRIESCKVVIDIPQNHKHNGKIYNVTLEILVPGKKLVVNRNPNEDLYVAIRDAFDALTNQVKDYRDRQQGDTKTHQEELRGTIDRLFSNYGFITTAEGEEFYFNGSNVLHSHFDDLRVGSHVKFQEGTPGETLQAIHVVLLNNE